MDSVNVTNGIILTPIFNGLSRFHRHLISYLISSLDVHCQHFIFLITHLTLLNLLLISHMIHISSVCFTSMFHHLTRSIACFSSILLIHVFHLCFISSFPFCHMHVLALCISSLFPFAQIVRYDPYSICTNSSLVFKARCPTREPQSGSLGVSH